MFGKRAADSALTFDPATVLHTNIDDQVPPHTLCMSKHNQRYEPEKIRAAVRMLMWEKVGIVRRGMSLGEALEQLKEWNQMVSYPSMSREHLELANLVTLAQCITRSAVDREESVGAHYRIDFPHT